MKTSHSSSNPSGLSGASREAVLETLRRTGQSLTVRQLSDELGLHANTVRFHLARLTKDGRVTEGRADRGGPGRPKLTYTAVSGKTTEPPGGYRVLAEILAGHLAATSTSPSRDAVAAGREWGRHLVERPAPFSSVSSEDAFERIDSLMGDLGFGTDRTHGPAELRVHHCPFRAVAERRPDVVCSVHLGLMRGALAEMRAPLRATDLKVSHSAEHPCLALFEKAGGDAEDTTTEREAGGPQIGEPDTVRPPDGE
ncbi:helix-turn-helix transcriptional regulator [Streptomyces sp. HK10]|uniref:helix-turn-helix transcriptional regulator n=1 Tax=Streptomyces sp. HK10 TaxID=3373255 RepID=UPI003749233C